MAGILYAVVDYSDDFVRPILLDALRSQIKQDNYILIDTLDEFHKAKGRKLLQFRSYEAIDFEAGVSHPESLFNSYIIRKSLIRKHYLTNTIFSWVTKHPNSPLKRHFKPAVDFELDYAEFLDDALVEAFEMRKAFANNEGKPPDDREWWILKPSLSDRGHGIRLFSKEDELQAIFEGWEAERGSESEEEPEDQDNNNNTEQRDYIISSHLRHFVAQQYIDSPLLIADLPYKNRKFHIRTYVVASGALFVYVYGNMLALFASKPYQSPSKLALSQTDHEDQYLGSESLLNLMRNVHLTNTCVQSSQKRDNLTTNDNENVYLLSSLPLSLAQQESITSQIHEITAELFRAALAHPVNFQPLPQSFEIFGVDFLVSCDTPEDMQDGSPSVNVWLLEVNAFPDFAQTGEELKDIVIKGLFEDVVSTIVAPHFGFADADAKEGSSRFTKVLNMDLKR